MRPAWRLCAAHGDGLSYLDHLPAAAEAVVIGGGVVGAATSFFLRQSGLRSVLLERRPRLCTLTTPASTGAFRLQFDNLEELELVRRSVDVFLNFAEVTGQRTYDLAIKQQGYLWLTTDPERLENRRRLVERQHAWGQTDIELLDGQEIRRRYPYVGPKVAGGRFRAGDGFLDPKALTMGFSVASEASFVTGCAVTGFRLAGGRLSAVLTDRGAIETDLAVIAGGPFSGLIARMAGIQLPVKTVVRRKVVMPDVPEVPPWAPMTIDDDTGAHWRPALRGAYLLYTDPATPPSPPTEEIETDHSFVFRLLDPASPVSVARIVPFWQVVWERSSAHWLQQAGQYTMTPDHRPLIGPTDVAGIWVNTGYSGHGIMGSPAGSQLLAGLFTGQTPWTENPFRLDRPFVRREVDVL